MSGVAFNWKNNRRHVVFCLPAILPPADKSMSPSSTLIRVPAMTEELFTMFYKVEEAPMVISVFCMVAH